MVRKSNKETAVISWEYPKEKEDKILLFRVKNKYHSDPNFLLLAEPPKTQRSVTFFCGFNMLGIYDFVVCAISADGSVEATSEIQQVEIYQAPVEVLEAPTNVRIV